MFYVGLNDVNIKWLHFEYYNRCVITELSRNIKITYCSTNPKVINQ